MNLLGIFLMCCLLMWILFWLCANFLPGWTIFLLPAIILTFFINVYLELDDRIKKLEQQLNPPENEEPSAESADTSASPKA